MVVDGTFHEFDKTGMVLAKRALSKKSGFIPFTNIGGSSGRHQNSSGAQNRSRAH
jgi:hypothetical protein